MILRALAQPNLAPIAALAFRDVCGECAEQLAPVAVQLIPACQVCGEYSLARHSNRHYSVKMTSFAAMATVVSCMFITHFI